MPSTSDVVALLVLLDLLPVGDDRVGRVGLDVAEHVRMAAHELGVHAARDVGDRERAGLRREHGVDHHLEEEVAELVLERVVRAGGNVAAGRVGRELVDRGRDLVRLFEHVPAQRVMGLRRVPRASARAAQPFGQREQPRELARHRDVAGVDEHRREMVGLDRLVELGERQRARAVRRAARAPAARSPRARAASTSSNASLTSESTNRVSHCASSIGPAKPGRVDRERARVDHPRTGHRIDAEPVPREVGERQAGHDLDVDARAAQQHDRALRDRRAARHRVRDLAVLLRGLDDPRRDRGVHRVEIVAGVVQQVERLEHEAFARELVDGRMARGAHVAHRDPLAARRGPRATTGRRRPGRARPRRRGAGSPARRERASRRRGGRRRARGDFSRHVAHRGHRRRRHRGSDVRPLLSR